MSKVLAILLAIFLCSCESNDKPSIEVSESNQTPALAPPPPPPPPPLAGSTFKPVPAAIAFETARNMGPGDCSDLEKMQGLPLVKQYGLDPFYDRIMVHIDSYEQCLLKTISNTTPTHIVPSYPGAETRSVGDLAFVLLVHGGKIIWDECTPESVIEQEKKMGSFAFYSWLKEPGSREKWNTCLIRKHGT